MNKNYSEWHKLFPGSGQGKHYPWLLEQFCTYAYPRALDYGAGKGGTIHWLESLTSSDITGYDPGYPAYQDKSVLDAQYDVVYACDCFEHIEREDIDAVIDECQSLAPVNLYIIDLTPAKKRLPDGRNAHILLLDRHQWVELIEQHEHTVESIMQYSEPDPNYGKRHRLCIRTRRS